MMQCSHKTGYILREWCYKMTGKTPTPFLYYCNCYFLFHLHSQLMAECSTFLTRNSGVCQNALWVIQDITVLTEIEAEVLRRRGYAKLVSYFYILKENPQRVFNIQNVFKGWFVLDVNALSSKLIEIEIKRVPSYLRAGFIANQSHMRNAFVRRPKYI